MVYSVSDFVSKNVESLKAVAGVKFLQPANGRFAITKSLRGETSPGRWWRSVVWDTVAELPVAVSPSKGEGAEFPMGGWEILQEHVDGVMINAWRVQGQDQVHIATRSYIGATNRFNGLKETFADLFSGIVGAEQLAEIVGPLGNEAARFTSFVLVSPSIKQTVQPSEGRVFVIHQGITTSDGDVHIEDSPDMWTAAAQKLAPASISVPSFPTKDAFDGFVKAKLDSLGWKWQGMDAKMSDGRRWRFTTDEYRRARSLRGNEFDGVERFLRLRRSRGVKAYLDLFSEDKDVFWGLEKKLRRVTQEVFEEYCAKNKAKNKTLAEVAPAYKTHVYGLHTLFIEKLKPAGKTVQLADAIAYMNEQPVERVAHLLRVGDGSQTSKPIRRAKLSDVSTVSQ